MLSRLKDEWLPPSNDKIPYTYLEGAKRFFSDGNHTQAITHIILAIQHRNIGVSPKSENPNPSVIFYLAANILEKNGHADKAEIVYDRGIKLYPDNMFLYGQYSNFLLNIGKTECAITLLKSLHDKGQGDTVTISTLGNAYLHAGRPEEAITLLKSLHDKGQGNTVTINTLGNAYLHAGRPEEAITLLKSLHDKGQGDTVTISTLGNAYVIKRDRRHFDQIKERIKDNTLKDYLDAKLSYFEGDLSKTRTVLMPYINSSERTPNSIKALFMACLPDESPILSLIRQQVGEKTYGFLIDRRDEWRENPSRLEAEMFNPTLSSSSVIFELGANPVSISDREKAGLKRGVPVAARPW